VAVQEAGEVRGAAAGGALRHEDGPIDPE
jgi:hypothetical protein